MEMMCNRFKEQGAVIIHPRQTIPEKYLELEVRIFQDHYFIIFDKQATIIPEFTYVQTSGYHIGYEAGIDETTITYSPHISCWVKSGNTISEEYMAAIENLSDLLPPLVEVKIPNDLLNKYNQFDV